MLNISKGVLTGYFPCELRLFLSIRTNSYQLKKQYIKLREPQKGENIISLASGAPEGGEACRKKTLLSLCTNPRGRQMV